ncbi:MAG: signal peptide peptidase SppA [Planctomycetota bacterium]
MHRFTLPLLALFALLSAGCLPNRIVLDLAPGDGTLEETALLSDPGTTRRSPKVAMIDVVGLITFAPDAGFFTGGNVLDRIVARLAKAEGDPDVVAVILRINSPGGTVAASEALYDEIASFSDRSGKPVVISMAELATSGGYYVALAGDHIVAQPATITGSIGVLVQTFNFSRGMNKIGIEGRAVVSGPNKAITNPFEPPVEEHYALTQELVDEYYETFRGLVATRRPDMAEDARTFDMVTDGRVFTGARARTLGLIDEVGSVHDAFDSAKTLADVPDAHLVKYHAKGAQPASVYSVDAGTVDRFMFGPGEQNIEVSLLDLDMPSSGGVDAGFYYLWLPARR